MIDEVPVDLKYNFLKMLELKNVSSEDKGLFVKMIMKEENLSARGFAKKYNIPHSTVHDWLSGRQMKKYYDNKEHLSKNIVTGEYFNNPLLRGVSKRNEIFSLSDRLLFVLEKKDYKIDEKTRIKLIELKIKIEDLSL